MGPRVALGRRVSGWGERSLARRAGDLRAGREERYSLARSAGLDERRAGGRNVTHRATDRARDLR